MYVTNAKQVGDWRESETNRSGEDFSRHEQGEGCSPRQMCNQYVQQELASCRYSSSQGDGDRVVASEKLSGGSPCRAGA